MSKLKKMKMPKKPSEMEMGEEYGMEMEESEEKPEMEMELSELEEVAPEMEAPESSMLADIPDEELMAELKKRGLSSKMKMEEEESEEEEELV